MQYQSGDRYPTKELKVVKKSSTLWVSKLILYRWFIYFNFMVSVATSEFCHCKAKAVADST